MVKVKNIKKVISGVILALFAVSLVAPGVQAKAMNMTPRYFGFNFWGMEGEIMDNSVCYSKDTTSTVFLAMQEIDAPVRVWVIGSLQQTSSIYANCSGGNEYYMSAKGTINMNNTVRQWNYTHAGIQAQTVTDEQARCAGYFINDVTD